jgi:hypothetical protein
MPKLEVVTRRVFQVDKINLTRLQRRNIMKRILIIATLAALLVVSPLAIKFARDANRYQRDLAAQVDTLVIVRSELSSTSDNLNHKIDQLKAESAKIDSMSQLYALASASANRLSVKVAKITDTVNSLRFINSDYAARLEQQKSAASGQQVQLADSTKVLADTRDRLANAQTLLRDRATLISQLQPWYLKWKHDATQRGWLAKLFGAGKAEAPGFPEPTFLSNPVDSLSSDKGAGMQASK